MVLDIGQANIEEMARPRDGQDHRDHSPRETHFHLVGKEETNDRRESTNNSKLSHKNLTIITLITVPKP